MKTLERAVNRVKDGYFWLIEKIERHPQLTFWLVLAYLVVRR